MLRNFCVRKTLKHNRHIFKNKLLTNNRRKRNTRHSVWHKLQLFADKHFPDVILSYILETTAHSESRQFSQYPPTHNTTNNTNNNQMINKKGTLIKCWVTLDQYLTAFVPLISFSWKGNSHYASVCTSTTDKQHKTENLTNQDASSSPLLPVTLYCQSFKQLVQIHYNYLNECRGKLREKAIP